MTVIARGIVDQHRRRPDLGLQIGQCGLHRGYVAQVAQCEGHTR
jgi:hypothetical protein